MMAEWIYKEDMEERIKKLKGEIKKWKGSNDFWKRRRAEEKAINEELEAHNEDLDKELKMVNKSCCDWAEKCEELEAQLKAKDKVFTILSGQAQGFLADKQELLKKLPSKADAKRTKKAVMFSCYPPMNKEDEEFLKRCELWLK